MSPQKNCGTSWDSNLILRWINCKSTLPPERILSLSTTTASSTRYDSWKREYNSWGRDATAEQDNDPTERGGSVSADPPSEKALDSQEQEFCWWQTFAEAVE